MWIGDALVALIIAVVLAAILVAGLGWRAPAYRFALPSIAFVFLILFLATWVGGVLLQPFGPVV